MLAARRGGRRMTVSDGTSVDLAGAASALVSSSVIEVETNRGDTIELWTIASDGDTVAASGPRLAVAEGMKMTCRLVETAAFRPCPRWWSRLNTGLPHARR